MPHSQLINDLLDGELDSAGEAALFGMLANDSDLRADFMQQLAIKTALQQDRATLVPPISLTGAVFTGLGFAAPFAGAAGASALSQSGGIMSTWLAKIGVPIMAALAAAGITYTAMQSNGATESVPPDAGTFSQGTGSSAATDVRDRSAVEAETATPSTGSPRVVERIVERIVERPSAVNEQLLQENQALRRQLATASAQAEVVASDDVPSQVPAPVIPVQLTSTIEVKRSEDDRVIRPMEMRPESPLFQTPAFSLSMRGLNGQSAALSVPAQTGWYQNFGIGMMYRINPSSAIGLEVGAESFPMSFEGTRNQQVVRFELQPLATWAGLTYRHVFPQIGKSGFTPFLQGLVGGTEFGPLGRGSAGLLYSPAGPLSFMLGVEGAALAFNHQSRWFTSTKYCFTYGVLVRL
jgi:hypothetical protein